MVKLQFDTEQITLREMLEVLFLIHNPTALNRQGNDVGTQYRRGIYTADDSQQAVAREVIAESAAPPGLGSVVTEVLPLANYWPAEDYHQDFLGKNPHQGYCMAVAAPKVAKVRNTFTRLTKPSISPHQKARATQAVSVER